MLEKYVGLLEAHYSSTKARVRAYGGESLEFSFDSHAPCHRFYSTTQFRGIQHDHGCWVNNLEFADYIVLLGYNPATAQSVVDRIACETMTVGLQVNTSKTKFSTTSKDPSPCSNNNGDTLEQMLRFKHLGSAIQPNGQV